MPAPPHSTKPHGFLRVDIIPSPSSRSESPTDTLVQPGSVHLGTQTYGPLPQHSPTSSYSPISPVTMTSTSETLADPEVARIKRSPKSLLYKFTHGSVFAVLAIAGLVIMIGVLAETIHFVVGCFALKECYLTRGNMGQKVYHHIEWVGVGAVGGIFATVPAGIVFYPLSRLDAWLRVHSGRSGAFIAAALLIPVAYIGCSVFGGFIGWQLLRHTLQGDHEHEVSRALFMPLIGSVVFSVPISLLLSLRHWSHQ